MGLMDGKVCIVTGGAGSLCLASAKLPHQDGAAVMLVDLHEVDLAQVGLMHTTSMVDGGMTA